MLQAFRKKLEKAESFDDALNILLEICDSLGYSQVSYAYQKVPSRLPDGRWMPLKLNTRNFPHDFEKEWEKFSMHDPYYHTCFRESLTFDWELVKESEDLQRFEVEAANYLSDIGIFYGFTTPIHLPGGRLVAVSTMVDKASANWFALKRKTQRKVFLLSHLFHDVIYKNRFHKEISCVDPWKLSDRQKQCLYWSASGRTAPEIATILELSPETIRMHLKNAMAKLGAESRIQAAVNASLLSLIDPYNPDQAGALDHPRAH